MGMRINQTWQDGRVGKVYYSGPSRRIGAASLTNALDAITSDGDYLIVLHGTGAWIDERSGANHDYLNGLGIRRYRALLLRKNSGSNTKQEANTEKDAHDHPPRAGKDRKSVV